MEEGQDRKIVRLLEIIAERIGKLDGSSSCNLPKVYGGWTLPTSSLPSPYDNGGKVLKWYSPRCNSKRF